MPASVSDAGEDADRLHTAHRRERHRRDAERSPAERMVRAYRLFCLWRPNPEEDMEVDPVRELEDVITHLQERFETNGVPFVIGGAFALAASGNPRFTYNLDVMVLTGLDHAGQALDDPRYERIDGVTFRETTTDLLVDLHPVRDQAQTWAAEHAELTDVLGSEVKVLTPEGLALMLLREATEGEDEVRPLRLRDIELLDQQPGVDWDAIEPMIEQMGYADAYADVQRAG